MKTRTKKAETTTISLRVTKEELTRVKATAKKLKLSVSETIRQAILK
jgi:predicted DNA binding CopG/RHH family protein